MQVHASSQGFHCGLLLSLRRQGEKIYTASEPTCSAGQPRRPGMTVLTHLSTHFSSRLPCVTGEEPEVDLPYFLHKEL